MRDSIASWVLVALIAQPVAAWAEPPKLALRGDGYLGYGNIDIQNVDADAFQGGGNASASAVFDRIYVQLDVFGDRANFEVDGINLELDATNVGTAGRVGWRDAERGSLGIVGAYDHLEFEADTLDFIRTHLDLGRIGLESELYLDRLTLTLNLGDLQFEDQSSAYLDAGVAFHPTDRARLDVSAGALDLEEDEQTVVAGAGGELLILDVLSGFVRWEASFYDGETDTYQHSLVVGARVYWGAETPSLVAYDRRHFKRSCAGYLLAGRIC